MKSVTCSLLTFSLVIVTIGCHTSRDHYPVFAHSHNDYEQLYPIKTALQHNFNSLEVDIFYHDGEILVSHDEEGLDTKPEFENDYLQPFLTQTKSDKFYNLLVDIKNYSDELIIKLNWIFQKHASRFYNRHDDISNSDKILITLSGDIPREKLIQNNENTYLFIDGRIEDLEFDYSQHYMPLISMNFAHTSDWKGEGEPKAEDLQRTARVISKVHHHGKWIRFWNTNDNELVWQTLINMEVDFIGVDSIERFSTAYSGIKK